MDFKQEPESFFYVKLAIKRFKRYWYVFALTISICMVMALLLNWYLQPLYEVSSVILIEENQNNKPAPSEEFMKSFSIFTPVSNIQQEVLKMKSTELIGKALKKINSEVTYYVVNNIKTKEVYNDAPFEIEYDKSHFQPMEVRFQIIPKGENLFQIIGEKADEQVQLFNFEKKITRYIDSFSIDKTISYGDSIKSEFISIRIVSKKDKPFKPGSKYYFSLNDLNNLTYAYQKALVIEQVAKDIEAAKITIKSKSPQQGIDFVNALTEAYLKRSIDRKNMVAESTIQYLNEQLNVVEDSLNLTEGNLQAFRSTNQVMDIASKADMTFRDANELENQRAELQARIKYYNYISNNLEKASGSTILVPSSMGVNDNVLTGLIEDYIRLNTERNTLIQNKQSQSPYFSSLTIKINNQKNTLSENVRYMINTNNLQLTSIEDRLRKENAKISTLPGTERKLVGIERKYKVNDDNYNFILRKKAEAQV
ncbi:MAG: hypothetical protein H0W84_05795, partial [Bacteroidetes bacterium]|nr:hypothetical protein [Bacteroidota bacterium]